MAERVGHWHEVHGGYAKFLQEENLALDKHQLYVVRWVREFLLFARAHAGYSLEQTLDLFLAEVGGRVGTKPWQLQQASDAIRIYRCQYRGAKAADGDSATAQAFIDDAARLERLREVILLRHYARSTETTYLQWNRRFLAYRHENRGGRGADCGRRQNLPLRWPETASVGHTEEVVDENLCVRRPAGCAPRSDSPAGHFVVSSF